MKDHYRTLNILPSAEDVVVRAAYRALAQRYHPDRWSGDPAVAESRMRHINEAYTILSDANKRVEYDKAYESDPEYHEYDERDEDISTDDSALRSDWDVAREYYDDLDKIERELQKVAYRLAFHFREALLETKRFSERAELAQQLERYFLERYFGKNEQVLAFAKALIAGSLKSACKELNRVMTVLGSNTEGSRVIRRIKEKHRILWRPGMLTAMTGSHAKLLYEKLREDENESAAVALIEACEGTIRKVVRKHHMGPLGLHQDISYVVSTPVQANIDVNNVDMLIAWCLRNYANLAQQGNDAR
jgi:curved DNA-binding protein CbpA